MMRASPTKRSHYWRRRLPRSKREVVIEETKLASREELEGLDMSALIVQKAKRKVLIQQMVDTFGDEIERIEELLWVQPRPSEPTPEVDPCRNGHDRQHGDYYSRQPCKRCGKRVFPLQGDCHE